MPNKNTDSTIVYVWTSRSQPRDLETGEIAFDISYDSKTSDWSRVPIRALIDLPTIHLHIRLLLML